MDSRSASREHGKLNNRLAADNDHGGDLQVTFSKVKKRPRRRVFNCPFCDESFPKDEALICHLVAAHSLQINTKLEIPKLAKSSEPKENSEMTRQIRENNSQMQIDANPIEEVRMSVPIAQTPEPADSGNHSEDTGEERNPADIAHPQLAAEPELREDQQAEMVPFCGICGVLFTSLNEKNCGDAFNSKCSSCDESFQQLSDAEKNIAVNAVETENYEDEPSSEESDDEDIFTPVPVKKSFLSKSMQLQTCFIPLSCCDLDPSFAHRKTKFNESKSEAANESNGLSQLSENAENLPNSGGKRRSSRVHADIWATVTYYQCEHCLRKFERKGNLSTHKKKFCSLKSTTDPTKEVRPSINSKNASADHCEEQTGNCMECSRTSSECICNKTWDISATHSKSPKKCFVVNRTAMTKKKVYTCQGCSRSYQRQDYLQSHQEWHCPARKSKSSTEVNGVECNLCGSKFASPANLRYHKKRHCHKTKHIMAIKKPVSSVPSTGAKGRLKLKGRMIALKVNVKSYTCRECPRSFGGYSSFYAHEKYHCPARKGKSSAGISGVECNFCGRKFASPANLKYHKKKHCHQEKRMAVKKPVSSFPSTGASRTLKLKGGRTALKAKVKVYTCRECARSFEGYPSLYAHEKYHCPARKRMSSAEKNRLKCNLCFKTLTSPTNLRKHKKKHCKGRKSVAPENIVNSDLSPCQ